MRLLFIFILLLSSFSASAQQKIPEDTYNNLRYTFTMLSIDLWKENDRFWHSGEYDRCIAMMRLITQVDPGDVEAYSDGAWLMQSQLRDEEAEAFLLEGVRNNTDIYDLYFELGHYYYYHTRYDEAVRYFETAVSFKCPELVWRQLAHALEHDGDPGGAMNIWLQLEYANPDDLVPQMQIDRLSKGEPADDVPAFMSKAREQRKEEERKKHP